MVTGRRGHSLAELVVALTVLGAGMAGTMAVAVVGSRRADEAVILQRAVVLAGAVLDSLVTSVDPPTPGQRPPDGDGLVAEWEVLAGGDAGPPAVVVTARRVTREDGIVSLGGLWIPLPPGPVP